MFTQLAGEVIEIVERFDDCQKLLVTCDSERRLAISYTALTGPLEIGDRVLLNTTAKSLSLGTGGVDFVVAKLNSLWPGDVQPGHIIKGRYLPCQQAVLTLEEQDEYSDIWDRTLNGFPVLVGQLHSQIAPAAAGLKSAGCKKVAYLMTDQAALPLAFSNLVRDLKQADLLTATITCGQAFGGDYETVTLHSALIAAKHIVGADAAIVCQGPGNAGTATKYGFSGIEQAQNLDIVSALGGAPIAIVRMSSGDRRERHQGISHHTRTTLELVRSVCVVPLPADTDPAGLSGQHDIRLIQNTQEALHLLDKHQIRVTTMGRSVKEDPLFFEAAAAAGLALRKI